MEKYKNKKLYIAASFKSQIYDKPVEINKGGAEVENILNLRFLWY